VNCELRTTVNREPQTANGEPRTTANCEQRTANDREPQTANRKR
jgi:hypothetical protein